MIGTGHAWKRWECSRTTAPTMVLGCRATVPGAVVLGCRAVVPGAVELGCRAAVPGAVALGCTAASQAHSDVTWEPESKNEGKANLFRTQT